MSATVARARKAVYLLRRAGQLGPREAVVRGAAAVRRSFQARFAGAALVRTALHVREQTGKSVGSQIREVVALRRGPGKLRPFDYYAYELFDDRRYTLAEKREFVGWRGKERHRNLWRVNDPAWGAVCNDKLITYAVLRGLCVPHPAIYAIFHPGGRTFDGLPSLRTPAELADFLRRDMPYPFFAKPVSEAFGRGASSIDGIDRDRDVLVLTAGGEIGVEEYARSVAALLDAPSRLTSTLPGGHLFQERIVQHPLIHRLSGGRVSSLRMVVLLGPDGPRLFRVTWKLPVGRNITDHAIGTSGNIKCSVDPATGRVGRVLRGIGPEGTPVYALGHYGTPVDAHPDTQERLTGVQLPDWDRTVALCLHAAAAFPGLRYQSWDFVMGTDGPLALELNAQGGIAQVPGERGLNDAEFQQFMASIGVV